MRLFGSDRIIGLVDRLGLDENTPIDAKMLSNSIEGAQRRIEDNNFKRRKNVLAYDDVMNQQRNIIYTQRQDVLNGEDISGTVKKMMLSSVASVVEGFTRGDDPFEWDFDGLRAHFLSLGEAEPDLVDFWAVLSEKSRNIVLDVRKTLYKSF